MLSSEPRVLSKLGVEPVARAEGAPFCLVELRREGWLGLNRGLSDGLKRPLSANGLRRCWPAWTAAEVLREGGALDGVGMTRNNWDSPELVKRSCLRCHSAFIAFPTNLLQVRASRYTRGYVNVVNTRGLRAGLRAVAQLFLRFSLLLDATGLQRVGQLSRRLTARLRRGRDLRPTR